MRPSPEAGSGNFVTFELRRQIKPDPTLQTVKLSFFLFIGRLQSFVSENYDLEFDLCGKIFADENELAEHESSEENFMNFI